MQGQSTGNNVTAGSVQRSMTDNVDHPAHYGGADDPYEAIKVIEAWDLGFHLGNAVKYIARAGKKDPAKEDEDIDKAIWYLQQYLIAKLAKMKPQEAKPKEKYDWREAFREAFKDWDRNLQADWKTEEEAKRPCREPLVQPPSVYVSVYTDIDKDPYKCYSIYAQRDWSIETLASLVATGSKEWACGAFTLEVGPESDKGIRAGVNRANTVDWLLKYFPPTQYSYYLKKVGP